MLFDQLWVGRLSNQVVPSFEHEEAQIKFDEVINQFADIKSQNVITYYWAWTKIGICFFLFFFFSQRTKSSSMEQHEWILNAYCQVKEARTVVYILEKAKLFRDGKQVNRSLLGIWEERRTKQVMKRGFVGPWNYSVSYCSGSYMALSLCRNP